MAIGIQKLSGDRGLFVMARSCSDAGMLSWLNSSQAWSYKSCLDMKLILLLNLQLMHDTFHGSMQHLAIGWHGMHGSSGCHVLY